MPNYEYLCHCGHRFEAYATMLSYRRRAKCPHCHGRARRVPSLPAIQTDTNFDQQWVGKCVGRPMNSRADMRAMEADGVVMLNQRERDDVSRKRGQRAEDELRDVQQKMHEPIKISSAV